MRLTLGLLAGITLAWAAAAIYRPTIYRAFHDTPATPTDHNPRFSTWHHGVRTEGPWE